MLFATYGQFRIFLWMAGAGAAVGAAYALATALRRLLGAGRGLAAVIDALWGVAAAAILLASQIYADYGKLRLYGILGALLGAGLFCHGPLPLLRKIFSRIHLHFDKIMTRLSLNRLIKVLFR